MASCGGPLNPAVDLPFDATGVGGGLATGFTPSAGVGVLSPTSEDAKLARPQSGVAATDAARLQVLLVDDDRTLREGCSSVLQIDGYAVTATGRGDEALELLRRRKFDIVLVDLYLTPVSGMDILRAAL